jgi:hypothetical protein
MDYFEILAECSIALLGFGAVHAVLRGSDGPRGVVRAWVVVTQGAFAFLLSILPLLLANSPWSPDTIWRASSAIGVIGVGALVYTMIRFDARLTYLGHPPQAPLNILTAKIASIGATILMILNVIGWPWEPGAFQHAVAVTLTLATGLLALLHTFYVPVQILFNDQEVEPVEEQTNTF